MEVEALLKLCRCPGCAKELHVTPDQQKVTCERGHVYPLLSGKFPLLIPDPGNAPEGSVKVNNAETGSRFSAQWRMHKPGMKVWGWDRAEMESFFLRNMGVSREQLSGKFVLDLGCGHGTYSLIMASNGAEVVAFDISQGFLGLEPTLTMPVKGRINFIQADISNLCLKEDLFDMVWCSGVLHHTPDTKQSFLKASRVVKKGGRFYVWLYKNVFYTKALVFLRKLTTQMPSSILVAFCYLTAPLLALAKYLLTLTKKNYRDFEKRTWREHAVSIHDTLAPPYRWHHDKAEVIAWFKEAGYHNITVSEDSALGFGIYGDR